MAATGADAEIGASTGPRPRGRGMFQIPCSLSSNSAMLQRGRARAGAECSASPRVLTVNRRRASTGPRPRGRGMPSLVTLSSASSQRLICDCLRPIAFPFSSYCGPVSHYSLNIKRLRHASTSGVFRITSPLAGSIIKEHQSLNHITRRIQFHIGQSQCRDYPIPPPLRRSQPNKNYLILIVVAKFEPSSALRPSPRFAAPRFAGPPHTSAQRNSFSAQGRSRRIKPAGEARPPLRGYIAPAQARSPAAYSSAAASIGVLVEAP